MKVEDEDSLQDLPEAVWCIVANVVNERPYGEGGTETRRGTKQFVPGAKVYIVNFFWGVGGETLTVVGRQRKSHRFITLSMRSKWLVNWRVELVYSPFVIKEVVNYGEYKPKISTTHMCLSAVTSILRMSQTHWAASNAAKKHAQFIVENLKQWHESANITQPPTTRPPQSDSTSPDAT